MVGGDHSFFVRFLPLGNDGVAPRKENASPCVPLCLRSALRRKGSRRRRHDATQRAESLLLSTEKQNGQAKMLVRFVGGTNKVQVELKVDSIKIIINIRQMRKNLTKVS